MKSVCRCYSFEAQDQGVCSAWDFSHFCCIKENFLHGYLRSFQVLLKIISKQIKWELIKCQPFTSENYLFSWNQSIQHASKSFPNAPCTTASVNCSVVHHWVRNLAPRSHGGRQAAVVCMMQWTEKELYSVAVDGFYIRLFLWHPSQFS